MSLTATLKARGDFSESDTEALRELKEAVYPPEETWEGSAREWASPDWGVFVRDDTGALVSYTGAIRRVGKADDEPVSIGGVGGIATHPDHRGKGYAPLGMGRALDFLAGNGAAFALLVCRHELVRYYESLGWALFGGELVVTQHGEPETFDFNEVMVGDLNEKAPRSGTIDLEGPPW